MGAILFLLWSIPRGVAGGGLLALLLFLLQRGLDLFADIHGDLQDLALAVDGENDLLAHGCLADKADQLGACHGLAVNCGDHIALLQASLCGRTILGNRLNCRAGRDAILLGFRGNIQNADANVGLGNITLLNNGFHNVQNGVDRNCETNILMERFSSLLC